MKKYYLILIFVCVMFSGFAGDVAKKNKEISSLLKSSNEDDMAMGSNQIIDGKKQNPLFVPLLINVLKSAKSSGAKCNAILALEVNRKYASKAVPALISCLKDKDYRVVHNAIDALGVLAYSPKKVVPTLLKLNMNDSKIKWHVFRALGHFGPSASEAIPLLTENVYHRDSIYVGEAREALYKITGKELGTDITSPVFCSTQIKKVEVLPAKIEYIYIKQNKDDLSIKVSLNHLNFPDVNSFLLYLKQNIVKIKNISL
jgi:HEAT repeats